MSEISIKSETFQRAFLLLLVVTISIIFLWMIRYFLMPLLFAALFSSLARPLYLRIWAWTKGKQGIASGLTLLVLVFLIILPLFGFVGIVANEAVHVTENVAPWVQDKLQNKEEFNRNLKKLPGSDYWAPYSDLIVNKVGAAVSGLGNFILKGASALTAGTVIFFINLTVMLYAMFFFFIDGPAILDKILFYMPLHNRDEKRLLDGFRSMARATIRSMVIIGAAQGTLAGLAFWMVGIPSALFGERSWLFYR
jgi:predicted PurR-regulated permease PerM